MSEISGNFERMEKEIDPENNVVDLQDAENTYKALFQDDFSEKEADKKEASGKEASEKDVDAKKVYQTLFEDDNKESDEVQKNDNNSDNNETPKNAEKYDYDEDGTRELTEEERQWLKDTLGWTDDKIDKKCRIDENGVIHYKTDCQDLEGKTSENGVPYERKTIEYKGVKIEGVFPVFDSKYDTELPEENYQSSSPKQFSECNKKLKEAIENDSELRNQFTEEELEDIENGDTPRGYTWHHAEEPGKMELVKTEDHDRTTGGAAHTGGNSIWGNKSQEKKQEGVSF